MYYKKKNKDLVAYAYNISRMYKRMNIKVSIHTFYKVMQLCPREKVRAITLSSEQDVECIVNRRNIMCFFSMHHSLPLFRRNAFFYRHTMTVVIGTWMKNWQSKLLSFFRRNCPENITINALQVFINEQMSSFKVLKKEFCSKWIEIGVIFFESEWSWPKGEYKGNTICTLYKAGVCLHLNVTKDSL